MNMLENLAEARIAIKNKTAEIFQSNELSQLARKTKFIRRSTSILQAKDFVDLMTASSVDPKSIPLEMLCSILRELNPAANMKKQSLMERINQPEATAFLKAVFEKSLKQAITNIVECIPPDILESFSNVYLEDCSECALNEELQEEFKGSGGAASKSSVKLDFIYEIKQRNIIEVGLRDRKTPDQKLAQQNLKIIKKGDLMIRDLGFFDADVFKNFNEIGAFFLSRLSASAHVYLNKDDKEPLDLARYIDKHFPDSSVIDIRVYVTAKKLPCRLIAYRVPEELAEKRRMEANRESKKKGRKQNQATINRLDFTFFITNVPNDIWEPEVVGTVYSVRWQIELIFKNWKSSLQIHYLKGINPDRIRCLLYAKLITIVIINIIYKFAAWFAQKLEREISLHKLVNWLKISNRLCVIILKGFSKAIFDSLVREIPKTLSKDKRKLKTTLEALEMRLDYLALYANSNNKNIKYQYFKIA